MPMRPQTLPVMAAWALVVALCACADKKKSRDYGRFLLEDGTVFQFARNLFLDTKAQCTGESVAPCGMRDVESVFGTDSIGNALMSISEDNEENFPRVLPKLMPAGCRYDRDSDEMAGEMLHSHLLVAVHSTDKDALLSSSLVSGGPKNLPELLRCETFDDDDACADLADDRGSIGLSNAGANPNDVRPTVASKTMTLDVDVLDEALKAVAMDSGGTNDQGRKEVPPSEQKHQRKANPFACGNDAQNALGNITVGPNAFSNVVSRGNRWRSHSQTAANPFGKLYSAPPADATWACAWADGLAGTGEKADVDRLLGILGSGAETARMANALAALYAAGNHADVFESSSRDAIARPLAFVRFALGAIALRWWAAVSALASGALPSEARFIPEDRHSTPDELDLVAVVSAMSSLVAERSTLPGTSAGLLSSANALEHLHLALAMHPVAIDRGTVTRASFAVAYSLVLAMPFGSPPSLDVVRDVLVAACGVDSHDVVALLATGLPPPIVSWPTVAQTALIVRVYHWWARAVRLSVEDGSKTPDMHCFGTAQVRALRWPLVSEVVETLLADPHVSGCVLPPAAPGESPSVRARALVRSRRVIVVGSPASVDFAHVATSVMAYVSLRLHAQCGLVPAVVPAKTTVAGVDRDDEDYGVPTSAQTYTKDVLDDLVDTGRLYAEPVIAMRALHDAALSRLSSDYSAVLSAVRTEERMSASSFSESKSADTRFNALDERMKRTTPSPRNASLHSARSRTKLSPIMPSETSSNTLELFGRSLDASNRPPHALEPLTKSCEQPKHRRSTKDLLLARSSSGLLNEDDLRSESRSAGHVHTQVGLRTDAASAAEATLVLALGQVHAHHYAHAVNAVVGAAVKTGACSSAQRTPLEELCQVHASAGNDFASMADELMVFSLWRAIPTAWSFDALVPSATSAQSARSSPSNAPRTPMNTPEPTFDDILQPGEAPFVYAGSATDGKCLAFGYRDLVRVLVAGPHPKATTDSSAKWDHFAANVRAAMRWRLEVDAASVLGSKDSADDSSGVRLADLRVLSSRSPPHSEAVLADLVAFRIEAMSTALLGRLSACNKPKRNALQRPSTSTRPPGLPLAGSIGALFPSLVDKNNALDDALFTVVPAALFEERMSASPLVLGSTKITQHGPRVHARFVRRLLLFATVTVPAPSKTRFAAYPYAAACSRPTVAEDFSSAHTTAVALRRALGNLQPVVHPLLAPGFASALTISASGRSLVPSPLSSVLMAPTASAAKSPIDELESAGRAHGIPVFPPSESGRECNEEYSVEAAQYVVLCHAVWRELLASELEHRPGTNEAIVARNGLAEYVSCRAIGLHVVGNDAAQWSAVLSSLFGRRAQDMSPRYIPSFATFLAIGLALLARLAVRARMSSGRMLKGVFGALAAASAQSKAAEDSPTNMLSAVLFLQARGVSSAALYSEILTRGRSDYVPARQATVVQSQTVSVLGVQATQAVSPDTLAATDAACVSRTAVLEALARWDVPQHVLVRVAESLPEIVSAAAIASALDHAVNF